MSLLSIVDAILKVTKAGLSAEEKYFLIRLLAVYGYEEMVKGSVVGKTIDELEKCLGMSDNLIKKVRDSLTVKNYLTHMTVSPQSKTGQGRPRAGFSLSKEMINLLDVSQRHCIHEDHIPRIERLLLWHDKGSGQQKSINDLKPSNRILLAILYSRANSCGAVYNLGVMQLAKLSGLKTRDRTENQLEKLAKLGFILDRVSGVSGKIIWKSFAKGAFFLNVLYDQLSISHTHPLLLLMNNRRIFGYQGILPYYRMKALSVHSDASNTGLTTNMEGEILFEHSCKQFRDLEPSWDENILESECEWMCQKDFVEGLKLIFGGFRGAWSLGQFIQYQINRYASLMLSRHWTVVQMRFTVIQAVMTEIKTDILPERFRHKLYQDNPNVQAHLSALELYLYRFIFETALLTKGLIKKMLPEVDEKILSQSSYEILTSPYIRDSYITQYGIIVKLGQEKNSLKAVTLNIEYDKNTLTPLREIKSYHDYSFIKLKPWSLFGLNIRDQ